MTSLDYIVLAVIGLSMLLSLMRGAVREMLSVISWVLAIYLALHFSGTAATFLPVALSNLTLRSTVAFLAVLLGSLLILALISMLLSRLIQRSPLSGIDRLLGAVFGFARALVILTIVALAAGLTAIPRDTLWRDAKSRVALETLALWARDHLPTAIAARIHYD